MDHVFPCKLFRLFAVARQHGVQNQDVFLLRKADLIVVFFRFQPNPAVMFIDQMQGFPQEPLEQQTLW